MSLRPLLVSQSDGGGGGFRAAHRLHEALLGAGIPSTMIVDRKVTDDPRVVGPRRMADHLAARVLPGVEYRIGRWLGPNDGITRSTGLVGGLRPSRLSGYPFDVVNLHWTNSGMASIGQIGRLPGCLVWTLHDQWPLRVREHQVLLSDAQPEVHRPPSRRARLVDRAVADRKAKAFRRRLIAVCPSTWIAEQVSASELAPWWVPRVIPNPVPLDRFRPQPASEARRRLGIDPDARVVLVNTESHRGFTKGADLAVAALNRLVDDDKVCALLLGGAASEMAKRLACTTHVLGQVADDELVSAYAACDVVVVPSRIDNLPQIGTEGQSCGRPVVAFRVGGLADVVDEGTTGLLVDDLDPAALAAAVERLLRSPNLRASFGVAARRRAELLWSPGIVAKQYLDVYTDARSLAGDPGSPIA